MRIIISNKQSELLKESITGEQDEITFYGFSSYIKQFLKELLINPIEAKVNVYLVSRGLNKSRLVDILIKRGIILKEEKIVDDNIPPKFSIKYKIPRKNFEKKLKRLYSRLFEVNLPKKIKKVDECDAGGGEGGATSASAVNASAPIMPIGNVMRRKIYITQEQYNKLIESTTTGSVGNYQYDVPFMFKTADGSKDEAYIHNKKGGISMERLK